MQLLGIVKRARSWFLHFAFQPNREFSRVVRGHSYVCLTPYLISSRVIRLLTSEILTARELMYWLSIVKTYTWMILSFTSNHSAHDKIINIVCFKSRKLFQVKYKCSNSSQQKEQQSGFLFKNGFYHKTLTEVNMAHKR